MKTIYVFGNEVLDYDNLAKNIAKEIKLENINFKPIDSLNEIFDIQESNLNILDVVKGITKTTLITDLDKIQKPNMYSLHDFDITFYLKLMKELKRVNKINIIGIPQSGDKEEIKKEVIKIIHSHVTSKK
ncbi:MAG: hypothetical protein KJ674_00385 [Nanoarchaeota archaeon]|nr:hypothetical protein [Nanoarchaeota archaeon]